MKRQTITTAAVAAGSAALLIGTTALATVAITGGMETAAPAAPVTQERTWEALNGELGESVFVEFVRNTTGTGFSSEQIIEDAQDSCRQFASGTPGTTMVRNAQAKGDYQVAILAGSVNFYCDEYSEDI